MAPEEQVLAFSVGGWEEELPAACPPADAFQPSNMILYRLVNDPPSIGDFLSSRAEYPHRPFPDECVARSVSLHSDRVACESVAKLPRHQDKKVAKIVLSQDSGLVKQTFGPQHFSWWRKRSFDPLTYCEILCCGGQN